MRHPSRDVRAAQRAKEMHRECMKDPDYAATWNRLIEQLGPFLMDIPADALADDKTD